MTNKKPKVNTLAYTELSIQIATLSAKVDKLLELAMNQQQWTVVHPMELEPKSRIYPIPKEGKNTDAFCGSLDSDDEKFLEEFK